MIVKLSRIVVVVLSVVSILSTGCAPVPPPPAGDDSSALTEDKSFARTEAKSSASGLPAITRDLRRLTWEVGPEAYYYKYVEEGFMQLEGMYYGLNLGFTLRNWLPTSPELSSEAMDIAFWKLMLRGEARFAFGDVDYEAPGWGSVDNVGDRTFEVRLLVGPEFPTENTMFTVFTGLGYRYLHNDTRTSAVDPSAYERESQYLYLPLGAQMTSQLSHGWSWGLAAELDVFLWGNQRSHIDWYWIELYDPGPPPIYIWHYEEFIDNYQERGYGLRASAKLQKKGDKIDLIIEPFIRYWNINESNKDWAWLAYEPTNSTMEAGVRVMLGF